MNKGQKVLVAACAGYFGLCLSIIIKNSKEAKLQKEARRQAIRGCWTSFIDMLAGAMIEEAPDPFKNERIKLKIHSNHGDVNLNKDLGQK